MSEAARHIFISYARSDGGEHAARLDDDLKGKGFATWRDLRDIDPYQDFSAELEAAIEAASCVVVCLTHEAKRGDSFVRREIGYAGWLKTPIITLRFEDIPPHISIVNNEVIDVFKGYETALRRLLEVLGNPSPTPPQYPGEGPGVGSDPYRAYTQTLLRDAVDYLRRYVLDLMPGRDKELPLISQATPEAVAASRPFLREFFAMQDPAAVPHPSPAPTREKYENFQAAFEAFNGRVLLLGDPGAGKTTTLMAFARDAAARRLENEREPLPILARISTWDAQKKPPLHKWLVEQSGGVFKSNEIENLIASGEALLLLDGLDELGGVRDLTPGPSPLGREAQDEMRDDDDPVRARRAVPLRPDNPDAEKIDPRREFMQIIPAAGPVVVSCRIVDYGQIGDKARLNGAVTLQPLSAAQIEDYLRSQPDLWAAIKDDKELLAVASTPLLLSYFAYAFRDLPEETKALRSLSQREVRTKIFDVYVKRRFEWEKAKRPDNVPIPLEEMERVLGEVAYDNASIWWRQRANNLNILDFQIAARSTEYANAIVAQAQMLNLLAWQELRFVHLLLRDYFAFPVALQRFSSVDEEVRVRSADVLWLISDVRAVEPLIHALNDVDEEIRSIARGALLAIGSPAVEYLIQNLNAADKRIRRSVVALLRDMEDSRAVIPLIATLQDADKNIQQSAIAALGKLGDPRAVEPISNFLDNFSSNIRRSAAIALGNLGDARAVEPLIAALKDADWSVRRSAAAALGAIGDPRAIEPLISALQGSDRDVRRTAAEALERIGTPEALAAVKEYRDRKK